MWTESSTKEGVIKANAKLVNRLLKSVEPLLAGVEPQTLGLVPTIADQ